MNIDDLRNDLEDMEEEIAVIDRDLCAEAIEDFREEYPEFPKPNIL